MLIQQTNGVGGLQLFQNQFTLSLLLLLFRKVLGIFQLGDGYNLKGHVVIDALHIVTDAGYEVFVDGLADLYQNGFQTYLVVWNPSRFM